MHNYVTMVWYIKYLICVGEWVVGKPLKNIKGVVGCVEETCQLARAKSDTGGRGREGIGIGLV